jgi:hypothetical protein
VTNDLDRCRTIPAVGTLFYFLRPDVRNRIVT